MSFESQARSVLPMVRNAPFQMVVDEVREAAIGFFRKSMAWRAILEGAILSAGSTRADLDLPQGAVITHVFRVAMDGRLVEAGRDCWMSADDPAAMEFSFPSPRDAAIVVTAALAPSYNSAGLPRELESEHASAIRQGALARLKVMSGTEWFDPNGAAIFHEHFRREIATAHRTAVQSMAGGSLRVRPVSFF